MKASLRKKLDRLAKFTCRHFSIQLCAFCGNTPVRFEPYNKARKFYIKYCREELRIPNKDIAKSLGKTTSTVITHYKTIHNYKKDDYIQYRDAATTR